MSSSSTNKALVVGGSGFLGSSISKQLVAKGYQTLSTYHSSRAAQVTPDCLPVLSTEIFDLPDDINLVFIAAGNHSMSEGRLHELNIDLPRRLLVKFPSARFLYVSSVSVYGTHTDTIRETSELLSPTPYGKSKQAGEAVIREHPRFAIVRPTYLYGVDMPVNSFLPTIVKVAKTTKRITLFGDGQRLQDYLHVDDAARLCVAAAEYDANEIFLGATGKSITNTEVVGEIQRSLPSLSVNFEGIDTAPSFKFDPSHTKSVLNWSPSMSFPETIKAMVEKS